MRRWRGKEESRQKSNTRKKRMEEGDASAMRRNRTIVILKLQAQHYRLGVKSERITLDDTEKTTGIAQGDATMVYTGTD